jgi:hypothetical protein
VTVNGTNGVAALIDRHGRLVVQATHGELVTVDSGEVAYEH